MWRFLLEIDSGEFLHKDLKNLPRSPFSMSQGIRKEQHESQSNTCLLFQTYRDKSRATPHSIVQFERSRDERNVMEAGVDFKRGVEPI